MKNMKLTDKRVIKQNTKSILAKFALSVALVACVSVQASGITYFLNENTKADFEIRNIPTTETTAKNVVKHTVRNTVRNTVFTQNIYQNDENPITDKLFENEKISISTAYPNPAVENVSFDYKLSALAGSARITLSDVFGNKIGSYELSHEQIRLRISVQDLPESIYFYTLHVDGKVVITKKLVVRR